MNIEVSNKSSDHTPSKANTTNSQESLKSKIINFFSNKDNYLKFKWFGLGVVLTLIIVVAGFYLTSAVQKQNNSIGVVGQVNKPTYTQNISPTPTPIPLKPIDPNAWVISISKGETVSTHALIENNLVYALKNEYKSTVYKRNLQNSSQTKILEFDEVEKAEKSGNLWEGLPPNMALSPNKNQITFIDNEGLKLFDIQSGNIKVFISQTSKPTNEEAPPKWSVSGLGAYSLARPLWSLDGKYISFLQSQYEGASFGAIDTESSAYIPLKSVAGGYGNLSWSPVDHVYVKASSGGYEGIGLYVSSPNNIAEANNIAVNLGKTEDTPFLNADFSPNGQKIVFTFEEPYGAQHLAVANSDGTSFILLDNTGGYSEPFFSSDGNSVFVIQKRGDKQVLIEVNLANKKAIDFAVLPSEFNSWRDATWTKDGYLVLVGVSSSSSLTVGGDSTRLVILDLKNKKVVYASSAYDQFTTFAGFFEN